MINESDLLAMKKVALDLFLSSIDLSSDIRMLESELKSPESTPEYLHSQISNSMQYRKARTIILYPDLIEREKRCWEDLIKKTEKDGAGND